MEGFIDVISRNINTVIVILGIVIFTLIIINAFKLSYHRSRIDDVMKRKRKKRTIGRKTWEMNESEEDESVTPEMIRDYEKEFNHTRSLYFMYIQLIPIFPLLGILGTVSGLMSQVVAENIDALYASLNIALGSTWWGLIFAITLKFTVALFPGKIVDDVEIMLDDYYNKFNDALAKKNIVEE